MKSKKAEILTENLIFIILNLVFFSILAGFIYMKATDSAILEEAYAKKIALVLDGALPGMTINIDMTEAVAKKDKKYTGKIVDIQGNLVTVKLSQKGGYSYSFFNDVSLDRLFFRGDDDEKGVYSFTLAKKDEKLTQLGKQTQ